MNQYTSLIRKLRKFLCKHGIHKFKPVLGPRHWLFGRSVLFERCARCRKKRDIPYEGGFDGTDNA